MCTINVTDLSELRHIWHRKWPNVIGVTNTRRALNLNPLHPRELWPYAVVLRRMSALILATYDFSFITYFDDKQTQLLFAVNKLLLSVKRNTCSFLRAWNINYYSFPLEDLGIYGGDVFESLTNRPLFIPKKCSWYSFLHTPISKEKLQYSPQNIRWHRKIFRLFVHPSLR